MPPPPRYVQVAVGLPLRRTFTYRVPPELPAIAPGERVLVPFRRRLLPATILGPADPPETLEILPLRCILEGEPSLPEGLLPLLEWAARYYLQPIGELIKAALPGGAKGQTKERYALTPRGDSALSSFPPGSAEGKLLRHLKDQGPRTPLPGWRGKGTDSLPEVLGRLLSEGLIEGAEFWRRRIREKTETRVRLGSGRREGSLTPRQREALDFLEGQGDLPLLAFKKRFPRAAAILRQLQAGGWVELYRREVFRQPSFAGTEDWTEGSPDRLTAAQEKAVEKIGLALRSRKFHPFLLHGVTGSGKTEVYLRAILDAVSRGRPALLLVPEIALTAQLVSYFRSRIDFPLAVLHSALSPGERLDEWRRIRLGLAKLTIGARSAIFAPLPEAGIIIVDEEHDPSYKQEEKVRYHARDLALVRGRMEKAVVVLGSATPSLESFYHARAGKFSYLSLPERIDCRPFPEIQVLDLRGEQGEKGKERIFAPPLEEALKQSIAGSEQALLFLNRRGFSTFTLCRDCGFVYKCPNCDLSLVYHLSDRTMRCHYCDHALAAPSRCPQCAGNRLSLFGLGTQRVEEEVKRLLPAARVGRMDRDTTTGKAAHQKILDRMHRGEIDLLIGTQMITKGHDLPGVTLVGVVAADLSLHLPDFRASERTFQLLTQVAGRAGRGERPGRVFILTFNP
ncbi:MAG: primosomal protein N', partial [Deltaproteobacteria bacterium]|nr:primosomal protein N' [Deltaproteobacteria bacterium]